MQGISNVGVRLGEGLKRLQRRNARARFELEQSANNHRSMTAENGIVSMIIE